MDSLYVGIFLFCLTIIFGIISWLLNDKDSRQSKEIANLWIKHDLDATALQDLRLQIAANHYERRELDSKFDRLETTFTNGFNALGEKFDRLSTVLTNHMVERKE